MGGGLWATQGHWSLDFVLNAEEGLSDIYVHQAVRSQDCQFGQHTQLKGTSKTSLLDTRASGRQAGAQPVRVHLVHGTVLDQARIGEGRQEALSHCLLAFMVVGTVPAGTHCSGRAIILTQLIDVPRERGPRPPLW